MTAAVALDFAWILVLDLDVDVVGIDQNGGKIILEWREGSLATMAGTLRSYRFDHGWDMGP